MGNLQGRRYRDQRAWDDQQVTADGLIPVHSGKVRDLYRTADGTLLMVASDRISAYDIVLDTPIPDKGRVLTALSVWWFEQLPDVVPHHLISAAGPAIPTRWQGRAMLCRPLDMIPVECVARGYLAGSGWADYQSSGQVSGLALPPGLHEGSRLTEPIFTPSTKAPRGQHDEPMTFGDIAGLLGEPRARQLREITLAVYARGAELSERAGVLLADTKIELGVDAAGRVVLADEVLTPDSSRFWPADQWQPGRSQPSYDKQFVRDWLTSPAAGWDRRGGAAPPRLPDEVVAATRDRYIRAYELLTGRNFSDWPGAAT
jgi:phosphoribosylaminoimidazole-succinocarboxamide synthase